MTVDPPDPSTPPEPSVTSIAPAVPAAEAESVAPPAPPAPSSVTVLAASPRPAWLLPTITGVAGLVVGAALMAGVMSLGSSSGRSALLSDAVDACGVASATGIDLADEGRSITFDMKGEGDVVGADIGDIACLFAELDVPSAVSSHIDQTTSMDGRQTETWGDVTVSWSYHPDRGLDGVLALTDN